jgi:predicted amidophosphoribosyltransferase
MSAKPFSEPDMHKWLASLFSYHDKTIKSAIWDIKYHGHFVAADAFGERLADAAAKLLANSPKVSLFDFKENDSRHPRGAIIVPIPPSVTGKKKRGYNQAAIIARALFENAHFPARLHTTILEKIKKTEKQATLHERSVRLRNMDGAFAVSAKSEKFVRGSIIMLVDDVTTTGATLCDARRALFAAGAKEVLAVTIAH